MNKGLAAEKRQVVVCVDCERGILNTLRFQLESHFSEQFDYECAENMEEAIELIQDLQQDGMEVVMVISDCFDEKENTFLQTVRSAVPKAATVMLVGVDKDLNTNFSDSSALQVDALLRKPWNKDEISALKQVLFR